MPKVTEAHMAARRQQILDAAFACFSRNGFHQTTMQHICGEAELSPGAVYRYFDSKEAIIEASCLAGQQRTADAFEAAAQQGETLEVLDELVNVFYGAMDEVYSHQDLCHRVQLWGEALRNVRVHEVITRIRGVPIDGLERVVHRAQSLGEINPDLPARSVARLLMATYDGLVLQKAIHPDLDVEGYMAALKALYSGDFWRGPTARPSGGHSLTHQ